MEKEVSDVLLLLLQSPVTKFFLVCWSVWFVLDTVLNLVGFPLRRKLLKLEIQKLERDRMKENKEGF